MHLAYLLLTTTTYSDPFIDRNKESSYLLKLMDVYLEIGMFIISSICFVQLHSFFHTLPFLNLVDQSPEITFSIFYERFSNVLD